MTLERYAVKIGFDEASEQTHLCGDKFGISLLVRRGDHQRQFVLFGERSGLAQARNDMFQWLRDVRDEFDGRRRPARRSPACPTPRLLTPVAV